MAAIMRAGSNATPRRWLHALAALAFAGAAEAASVGKLQLNSESGDPIGGGVNTVLDIDSATLSAFAINNRLHLNDFPSSGSSWGLTLASPKYPNPPGVGCHERARRGTFVEARPGLDFGLNHVGCNAVLGRYRIHELSIDPSNGRIDRLAVDFVQHCDGKSPALFGKLRLGSTVPLDTAPMQRAFVTQGRLDITSPPGEPLGGQNRSYTFDERSFRAWGPYSFSSPSLSDLELFHRPETYSDNYWSLVLTTRGRRPLTPRVYGDARDAAFGDPSLPGMSLGLGAYVCGSSLRGQFDIRTHERDRIDGLSTHLSAHLTQRCSVDDPPLDAQLDYTTSMPAGALADDVIFLDGHDYYRSWPLTWNCP